jgi:hypothetical protein
MAASPISAAVARPVDVDIGDGDPRAFAHVGLGEGRPMPRAAPVIRADLPSRRVMRCAAPGRRNGAGVFLRGQVDRVAVADIDFAAARTVIGSQPRSPWIWMNVSPSIRFIFGSR